MGLKLVKYSLKVYFCYRLMFLCWDFNQKTSLRLIMLRIWMEISYLYMISFYSWGNIVKIFAKLQNFATEHICKMFPTNIIYFGFFEISALAKEPKLLCFTFFVTLFKIQVFYGFTGHSCVHLKVGLEFKITVIKDLLQSLNPALCAS